MVFEKTEKEFFSEKHGFRNKTGISRENPLKPEYP